MSLETHFTVTIWTIFTPISGGIIMLINLAKSAVPGSAGIWDNGCIKRWLSFFGKACLLLVAGLFATGGIATAQAQALPPGTMTGWGYNGSGQITIPSGLTNVSAIAAGALHSLALESDGTVVGWGDDTYGQTTIPAGLTN